MRAFESSTLSESNFCVLKRLSEADLDADHLQEVAAELHEMELTGAEIEDCNAKEFRFDLCPRCHSKYLKDPLGRDALRRLNFSEN